MREAQALPEEKLRLMLEDICSNDFGEEKKAYIKVVLSSQDKEEWRYYLNFVTDNMIDILLKRSRALPVKQFEEHLSQFYHWLAEVTSPAHLSALLIVVADGNEGMI